MKKYMLSLLPLIAGIGCLVSFNMMGSKVAADGTIVEPFYLLPMGYSLLAIGVIGLGVNVIKKVTR
ncbi:MULTISPECIES: DUF3955 domain-containing protein [unclassified Bacillus (in: firmicutes)]|uniref:DUF3955 domain-containing protein n=1 Tax=unclassified Bacillus (in: firmicutes) TaxID=185979 RepID=UPI0030F73081